MSDISVTALPPLGMITLRGDLVLLAKAVAKVTGCAKPDQRLSTTSNGCRLIWMSPDEYMLVCDHIDVADITAKISVALQKEFATIADVSDARAAFDLAGTEAQVALSRLVPVDFAAMAPTEVRRTRMAQVPAALWREGQGWRVICFRSVSRYAEDLLRNAART